MVKTRSGGWNISGVSRKRTEYENLSETEEAHWEVVERMLFIYAKLNPGQSYVQGMNEIIGPIYYTFSTDKNDAFRGNYNVDYLVVSFCSQLVIIILLYSVLHRTCRGGHVLVLYQSNGGNS